MAKVRLEWLGSGREGAGRLELGVTKVRGEGVLSKISLLGQPAGGRGRARPSPAGGARALPPARAAAGLSEKFQHARPRRAAGGAHVRLGSSGGAGRGERRGSGP